ncbi:hypothetical protein [Mucilaginibacter pedocola]|uniref:Uncharacterized protein n=1 Tax=Mucilaginibacter pedocola TaxID=1792845 RepID=A0A1S9PIX9_9SPHI|nr:hypothetical protein [Mucilaginibacter pedocola]OOQ60920.1 hypothetical protein BC343_23450 [Mucilaginibacter pedocola]
MRTDYIAFMNSIDRLSGYLRIKLNHEPLRSFFKLKGDELIFTKELPSEIKENVINTHKYIYFVQE